MFGFHPEADAWWAEKEGPEPLQGAAGFGTNTWAKGVIAYGQNEPKWGPTMAGTHDFESSGGHRRLSELVARPLVPLPVQWPLGLEPDHVACSPQHAEHPMVAVTATGLAALVPLSGALQPFTLEGLLELGMARGISWDDAGLLLMTGSGKIARCPMRNMNAGKITCTPLLAPPLTHSGLGGVMEFEGRLHAVVSGEGRWLSVLRLAEPGAPEPWQPAASVELPEEAGEVSSIALMHQHLLVTTSDGVAYRWELVKGLPVSRHPLRDVPAASDRRTWQSACVLPTGKILRLASSWQRGKGGSTSFRSELLL
eukprot:SRR837773.9916.p1 GENE.SRR837773.9916~~SRR837773.9916.p1  ORF type:complete len:344 (+),score=76.17 SRR837773.9916:100-1032(+)